MTDQLSVPQTAAPRPELWSKRIAAARNLPDLWRRIEDARAAALAAGDRWPGFIWMPLDPPSDALLPVIVAAMKASNLAPERINAMLTYTVHNAHTLATWRLGKGIYRFDDDLRAALLDTPVAGEIPVDILKRLPEWCVYIETPGYKIDDRELYGFFACTTRFRGEIVLHIVTDFMDIERDRILPYVPIPLTGGTIEDALAQNARRSIAQLKEGARAGAVLPESMREGVTSNQEQIDASVQSVLGDIGPLLSLVLYLCAEDRDLSGTPIAVTPQRTKRGERFFAAPQPNVIGVGLRLGARLREARGRYESDEVAGQGSVIAHLRRAHWHTYWHGPRSGVRERRLRWLHPIFVNERLTDDAPAVLHPVSDA